MAFQRSKILVAMSGGVDSSVAAAMLVRAGHEVVGCFMRLGSPGEALDTLVKDGDTCTPTSVKIGHQGCCSIADAADARAVAAELNIPFYVCNFKKDFGRIIDYFVDEYANGRTPNPCVRCNDWLKFGKLHEYAVQIGAGSVASGHYARIGEGGDGGEGGGPTLERGLDESKDQSYVLFGVPKAQLGHIRFPIGGLPKARVRDLAKEWGLPVFDKPDSQEICFVPDQDYAALVERERPGLAREGRFVDVQGRQVGTHGGQHRVTIGQRKGMSLSLGYPVFVVAKDPLSNTVTVGPREATMSTSCIAAEANWLVDAPVEPLPVLAKYRYNSPAVAAVVTEIDPGVGPTHSGRLGRFHVTFAESQSAVAPGQAVVLYDAASGARVLGGGWIESAGA